jgi:simple sugar transport system substrate-binding protein
MLPDEEKVMSEVDGVHDAIEKLEWADAREDTSPHTALRAFSRRAALTGGAAGLASAMLAACGSSSSSPGSAAASSGGAGGVFGSSAAYKFVIVNHVTTNPFFVPTQYGAADACKLLGCSYQWTGSETSNVSEMVNSVNTAVTGAADGIAVALIDLKAFNAPVQTALTAGIPVVAYNADAPSNPRLAYIGQDLLKAGQQMGAHILSLVPSGEVALFIATPGSANIQPRIDGALQTIKAAGGAVTAKSVTSGAAVPTELSTIDAYWVGHPKTKGLFAVDGGSTQSVAQVMQKYSLHNKGIKAGGFDLTPITQQLLAEGVIDFTIDQQPYLQGFLPILQLYMYKASQTLSGLADTDTGLKFLTSQTVKPYNGTKSRYEGTASAVGVAKA